jgi:hypothetical protein
MAAAAVRTDYDGEASGELVVCKYGTGEAVVQVEVPMWVLQLFRLFRDIKEDCPEEASFYIPRINDANQVPIDFNHEELNLFFDLAAVSSLTIQDLKKESAITQELLKRFLLLANFLDYEIYLNTLCQYTAILIKEGIFRLN